VRHGTNEANLTFAVTDIDALVEIDATTESEAPWSSAVALEISHRRGGPHQGNVIPRMDIQSRVIACREFPRKIN
jgi:hypothetical protein